jgi:hypothetical protein
MDTTFGGFRTRADATYKLLQAPGTAFLVVAAPERDALREAAYFVERLAAEDMPFAGLVLNRVHGSGAAQLSAERALAAAENLDAETAENLAAETAEELAAETAGRLAAEGDTDPGAVGGLDPDPAEDLESTAVENLDDARIVDQEGGKAGLRNSPDTYGSSESPASETSAPDGSEGPAGSDGSDEGSPAATDSTDATDRTDAPTDTPPHGHRTVEQLTAGLLRLHAERMQLLSREQRTRDRFAALHPEVAVAEVAALPGDVHDLAGLRDIGERLAANRPELPETDA